MNRQLIYDWAFYSLDGELVNSVFLRVLLEKIKCLTNSIISMVIFVFSPPRYNRLPVKMQNKKTHVNCKCN